MKTKLVVLSATLAAALPSLAAPGFAEFHENVLDHLKSVRNALVPPPIIEFVETFPPIAVPRAKVLHLAQAGEPAAPAGDADVAAIADWANSFAAVTAQRALDGVFPPPVPRRPVIVDGERDAKAAASLEEDLTVMMRILEKAAGGKEEKPRAMGIDVFSFARGPAAPRVFYLDGYGAMFVLNVRYPLLPPPSADDQSRTNEPTSSEWDKAREEVYGRRTGLDEFRVHAAAEEFDAKRVETLKQQIADDLANATHIKGLKPDDYVTVVVLGGSTRGEVVRREFRSGPRAGGFGGGGGGRASGRAEAHAAVGVNEIVANGSQSTMTIRAKKSDIDAFAKQKIEAGDFRKKVSISIR
jgi:hypothetical protein